MIPRRARAALPTGVPYVVVDIPGEQPTVYLPDTIPPDSAEEHDRVRLAMRHYRADRRSRRGLIAIPIGIAGGLARRAVRHPASAGIATTALVASAAAFIAFPQLHDGRDGRPGAAPPAAPPAHSGPPPVRPHPGHSSPAPAPTHPSGQPGAAPSDVPATTAPPPEGAPGPPNTHAPGTPPAGTPPWSGPPATHPPPHPAAHCIIRLDLLGVVAVRLCP